MELFSLLAKLTLDADDFNKEIDKAESKAESFEMPDEPQLTLDTEDFDGNIEQSTDLAGGFESSMETAFDNIGKALIAAGIVGMLGNIVSSLKEAINMTAETADAIDKGASRLGISRKAYQEWDHALKQSGASINDLKKGLMNMQLAWKSAQPGTAFADAEDAADGLADKAVGLSEDAKMALDELGLLGDLSEGKFKNAEQMMDAVLLKLAEFPNAEKESRGILVRALFGRSGDVLNDMLDEGYEGVKALMNEADSLGLIMSDQEIDNAVAYGDAVANLKAELQAIQQAFVADIIPVLTTAVTWLTDFLTKLNPRLQTSSIFDVFEQINQKTIAASQDLDEATAEASDLITKLQNMGNYWTLDEEGKMTWDALAARALELFPQLSEYIDTDGKKINGNTQEILANVKAWALLEKQRLLSNAMEEKQAALADQLTKAYEKGAEARKKESEAYGKEVTAIDQVNDVLAKNEELRSAVQGAFGVTELDAENAKDILAFIHDKGFETVGMDAVDEWAKLTDQASAMREEAEQMKDEANKAKDGLADEQKYLMEEMGYTEEEIKAITEDLDAYIKKISEIPTDVYTTFHQEYDNRGYPHSFAIGSSYIPYDNYPALLHRGEKVLTATEARQGGENVDLAGLEDRIEAAIRNGMANATVNSYLNGKAITDEVNRNNMQAVKGRRFTG